MTHRRPTSPRDAERRTERAWQEDGIPELMAGCFGLILGVTWLGIHLEGWPAWLFLGAIVGGAWAKKRATEAAKVRIADRRVGYVRPRPADWSRGWRVPLLVGLVAAVLGVLDRAVGDAIPGWRLAGDWWMLLVLVGMGVLDAVVRRNVWSFVLATIPLAFMGLGIVGHGDQESAFGWTVVVAGLASVVFGAWRLLSFLRRYPSPAGT